MIEPEWIFPFENMQVGESFFIPTMTPSKMIYAIETGSKRAKIKIKTYITSKDGIMGVRAWRLR